MADGLMAMPSCEAQTERQSVDDSVEDTFLFYPRFDPRGRQPFRFQTIHEYQQNNPQMRELVNLLPDRYFIQQLDNVPIICRRDHRNNDNSWKIALPNDMLRPLVKWFHEATVHSLGMDRLEAVIRRHFFHPNIRQVCRDIVSNCTICPQVRTTTRPAGQLAPRNAPILPWSEVHIDFIGPWKIKVNRQQMEFNALTCIDPVTNLTEIIRLVGRKTADNARRLFENHWLSRYPRPLRVVHDNGPEFIGHDFQLAIENAGIARVNISPNTPTANSIAEASHKSIGQVIRTLIHLHPPANAAQAARLVDEAIATAMHALRCNPVSTLGNYSPGALVFSRDMFLNIPLVADILTLTRHRQALIDKRLIRANRTRSRHEYVVGQQIWLLRNRTEKLELTHTGPWTIIQVHTNNTVTIQYRREQHRLSIRLLTPHRPS
jgi:transposase InsO family protein